MEKVEFLLASERIAAGRHSLFDPSHRAYLSEAVCRRGHLIQM